SSVDRMGTTSRVEEVLQWMYLALGAEPDAVGDVSRSITDVVGKSEFEQSFAMYEAGIKAKNEHIEQLHAEVEARKTKIGGLEVELELLRTTNSTLKAEMERKDAKIAELEESLNSLVNNNNNNNNEMSLNESMELMELMEKENEQVLAAGDVVAEPVVNPYEAFLTPLIPTFCGSAFEATHNFQTVFDARYGEFGGGYLMSLFFNGSLQAAIQEAFHCSKPSDRRPLALYIHNDESEYKNIFPTTVLCCEGVMQMLHSQFIVWPWDATAQENKDKLMGWLTECQFNDIRSAVSCNRRIDKFPMIALVWKKGEHTKTNFIYGSSRADDAMDRIIVCLDSFESEKARQQ
ncbi:hypothetical protein PRIPAC_84991, partial [Pristionchus pacificus]